MSIEGFWKAVSKHEERPHTRSNSQLKDFRKYLSLIICICSCSCLGVFLFTKICQCTTVVANIITQAQSITLKDTIRQ
ncbi:hypothetical protein JHK85_052820 [Glycine max]|uniref:Uncharacterized protein n=1 Tax=Glycine max TaxID=3847 RepID=K7MVX2_SOYBN|nr:hypothetical protein JHK85_052820 [Glycine max]KAH1075922.1 hypothetical protein GYH30_051693 [Glycine max]